MASFCESADESDIGAAGVGPVSIVLTPRNFEPEDERVSAVRVAHLYSLAERLSAR